MENSYEPQILNCNFQSCSQPLPIKDGTKLRKITSNGLNWFQYPPLPEKVKHGN